MRVTVKPTTHKKLLQKCSSLAYMAIKNDNIRHTLSWVTFIKNINRKDKIIERSQLFQKWKWWKSKKYSK